MVNLFLRSRAEQLTPDASPDSAFYLHAFQIEYLLKELEFQVAFEGRARDRAEQMVSYLLTTIAAILGAVFLIVQGGENYIIVAFVAATLIWMFSAFCYYRVCRLRNAITHARLNRRVIRSALEQTGLKLAAGIVRIEGPPSGFSWRVVINLNIVGAVSSLAAGVSVGLCWALFRLGWVKMPAYGELDRYLVLSWPAFIGFLGTTIVLVGIYRSYYLNSERMIKKYLPG